MAIKVVWNYGTGIREPALAVCTGADIDDGNWQQVDALTVRTTYQCFVDAVMNGETKEPSFEQAAKIQRLLDIAMNAM